MHSTKHAVLWLVQRGKTLLFRPKWEKKRDALIHRCRCAAVDSSDNCNIPICSVNFMRSRWCQLGFSVLEITYFSPTFGWRQVISGMAANSPCRRWFFSLSLSSSSSSFLGFSVELPPHMISFIFFELVFAAPKFNYILCSADAARGADAKWRMVFVTARWICSLLMVRKWRDVAMSL